MSGNGFPKRIYACPEGQFGQGVDPIRLCTWNERSTYQDEQIYIRWDVADELLQSLKDCRLELSWCQRQLASEGYESRDGGSVMEALRISAEVTERAEVILK